MFGTFRKHQKWIWIGAIIIVIPSFVIYFSPDAAPGRGRGGGDYDLGSIDGRPISRDEYLPAYNEARLSYFIRAGGRWPGRDDATMERINNDAMSRLLMIRMIHDMDIDISDMAVAELARNQLSDTPVRDFADRFLKPEGLTIDDYTNFLRHEAGIQQLIRVAALSGQLVNPREAEMLFRKENEQILTEAVVFYESNYVDKVTVTPDLLQKHYTNRVQVYREPDRIQVNYVAFAASNFLAEADKVVAGMTNLTETIDEYYRSRGADFFKDTNDVVMAEEDAKQKIRDELRQESAMREAERKANQFGSDLLDMPQPNKAEDLNSLAAARGYQVSVTPPFSRADGLEDMNLPAAFRQQALLLNPNNPVRVEPIVGEDGAYVISFNTEIKGTTPSFEEIQAKVEEDYRRQEARKLLRSASQNFNTQLTNGLAQGQSFDAICQASQVEVVQLPAFSPSSRPPLEGWDNNFSLQMIQRQVDPMTVGQTTPFLPSRDGGYIVHLKGRNPVDEAKLAEELPEFTANLRQYRIGQAFDQWFRKKAEELRLAGPQPAEVSADDAPPAGTPAPPPGS